MLVNHRTKAFSNSFHDDHNCVILYHILPSNSSISSFYFQSFFFLLQNVYQSRKLNPPVVLSSCYVYCPPPYLVTSISFILTCSLTQLDLFLYLRANLCFTLSIDHCAFFRFFSSDLCNF